MELLTDIAIFLFKCVAISLVFDTWMYWNHVMYHSNWCPAFLKGLHYLHHRNFTSTKKFEIHPIEFLLSASVPFLFTWWIISPWFFIVVVGWGLFEAQRGHGQHRWFNLIPQKFYTRLGYCGYRYHMVHHKKGMEHVNLGQFLRIWDILMDTGYKPKEVDGSR